MHVRDKMAASLPGFTPLQHALPTEFPWGSHTMNLLRRSSLLTTILVALGTVAAMAVGLAPQACADPIQVALHPVRDNTLFRYQGDGVLYSNGIGNFLSAGLTTGGGGQAAQIQRGLLIFDVAGAIPDGAHVTEASLGLHVVDVPKQAEGMDPVNFWLVAIQPGQLQQPWGEGSSKANMPYLSDPGDSNAGRGRAAKDGDATWYQTNHVEASDIPPAFLGSANPRHWTSQGALGNAAYTPGFAVTGTVEDVRYLDESLNQYTWTSDQLADQMLIDLQHWIDDPASNFGWLLVGQEATTSSKRSFASREHANPDWWPTLTVSYTLDSAIVPEPSAGVLGMAASLLVVAFLRRRRR
jgi:MYXO-CTERM domain-containing protein